jgi:hypothetical protein
MAGPALKCSWFRVRWVLKFLRRMPELNVKCTTREAVVLAMSSVVTLFIIHTITIRLASLFRLGMVLSATFPLISLFVRPTCFNLKIR